MLKIDYNEICYTKRTISEGDKKVSAESSSGVPTLVVPSKNAVTELTLGKLEASVTSLKLSGMSLVVTR